MLTAASQASVILPGQSQAQTRYQQGVQMDVDHEFAAGVESTAHGALVVIVVGSIDIASAAQFKELLLETVEQRAPRIVIDLTHVASIDSTGLGVLVSAAKKAAPGSLALICADEAILNVFRLVGLDRIVAVHGSHRAALGPPAEISEEADDE